MKIYINNPKENWVVDRFMEEWISYNRHFHTDKIKDADLIWIISPWTWKKLPKKILQQKNVAPNFGSHFLIAIFSAEKSVSRFSLLR